MIFNVLCLLLLGAIIMCLRGIEDVLCSILDMLKEINKNDNERNS